MRSISFLALSAAALVAHGCADNGTDVYGDGDGGSDAWHGGTTTTTTAAQGGGGASSTTSASSTSTGNGGAGGATTSTATGGAGGASSSSSTGSGGSGGSTTTNTSSSSTSGTTTTTSTGGTCTGQVVTIKDLTDGSLDDKTKVQVKDVVATSRKFLVSGGKAEGDSCLWGVFVSAPGVTTAAPNTGVLALGYGDNVAAGATGCPKLADGAVGGDLPDDTKPGDVLTLGGQVSTYLPSTCGNPGETAVKQHQLGIVNCAHKKGTAAVPTPALLKAADLGALGGQSDAAFYDKWGGVKVRVEGVTAVNANAEGGVNPVGAYGNIVLEDGNVQVGDKLYYVKGSSQMCDKGPQFGALDFDAIEGFVTLDFCKWSLQVANKCTGFTPKSFDCGVGTCE